MFDMWFQILVGFAVLIGLGYTFLRALTAVQKEDIGRLSSEIKEVRSEVNAKFDALNVRFEALNAKFDRYLFSKLEKIDDSDKGNTNK